MPHWLINKKWRVILSGFVITALPILILSALIYYQTSKYISKSILTESQQYSFKIADHIKDQIENDLAISKLFISRATLRKAIISNDKKGMIALLREYIDNSITTERAFLTTPKGIMLADYPTDPSVANMDVSQRPWFKGLSKNWQPYVSEYYLRLGNPRRFLFSISMPVKTDDGKIIGAFVCQMSENYAKHEVFQMIGKPEHIVYVVDRNGNLIYHPSYTIDRIIDFSSIPSVQKIKSGETGTTTYIGPNGERVFSAYTSVPGYTWGVVVDRPEKEVFAPLREITYSLIIFSSIILLTGFYFAYRRSMLIIALQDFSIKLEKEIAARKETEGKLFQVMAAVESASDAIGISDAKGRHFYQNKALTDLFGYETAEELQAAGGGPAVVKDPTVAKEMFANIQSGKPWVGDLEMVTKDGRVFSAFERANAIKDDSGNIVGLIGIITDITERKQIEEVLLEKERHLRSVITATPIALWDLDASGTILLSEGNALSQLGIKAGELVGKSVFEVNKNDPEALELIHRGLTGEEFSAEVQVGGRNWRNQYVPRYDEKGDVVGLIGVSVDITELKDAEESLRKSEEHFRTITINTPDHIIIQDRHLKYTFVVNPQIGLTEQDMIGKTDYDFLSKEEADKLMQVKKPVLENGQSVHFETSLVSKAGTPEYFDGSYAPKFDSKGQVDGLIGYFRNVTERKKADHALVESERRLKLVTDNVPALIGYVDKNYRYKFVNKNYEKWFGQKQEDMLEKSIKELLPEETYNASLPFVNRVLAGEELSFEGTAILPDGTTKSFYNHLVPDRSLDGDTKGYYVLVSDITERKKSEEALARVEKLEAIGTLAAGIAHDFNNLLGVMFGFLELSQMEAEKNKQKEIAAHLAKARSAFNRAKDLTGQLLTFSKGGAPIRKTQSLSNHVRRTISFSLSGSNVSAEFNIPDDIWLSDFDENQIAQVLDNMVINARQAMPKGGILNVSLRNITASEAPDMLLSKDYVCVSVRDHGTGIAREHLPHIFEPFFTTKQMGSGLGLATGYSIIRQHDGLIDVDSELGKGTTFHIYLPASSGSVASAADDKPQHHRGKGKILIMDDEEMILDVLSLMLDNMGYQVTKTRDGQGAKEIVKGMIETGGHFVAAILDLTIPSGLGGKEIVYALRALDSRIKVIASSGYANDPIMSNPTDYGFAGRLTKPYRRSDLIAVLGSVLPDSE